jgi:hypothetical protein
MSDDNTVNENENTVGNSQQILDGLWLCVCCGLIGEVIGIIAARWCLASWMIWAGAAVGACVGGLFVHFPFIGKTVYATRMPLARTFSYIGKTIYAARVPLAWAFSYLFHSLKGLKQSVFKQRELTVDLLKQRLSQYVEQRRWIAYENIVRRFLATNPINSSGLAVGIYNVSTRIECCRSQFTFLMWYITGGFLFTFISYRLLQSQQDFPTLLVKVLPFLSDDQGSAWVDIVSSGLLVVLWFILVLFATNILLLLLHKKIIYRGSGWAVFVCFLLIAFPLMQFGLSKMTEIDAGEATQKVLQGEEIISAVALYLPLAQYWLIALSMLMFLRSLVFNTVINDADQTRPPIIPLLICAALLVLTAKLPFGLYLPESICFCVLLATTGMLSREQQTLKHRWSWLLVPFCCFFAVVLNLTLESNTVALLAVCIALFIGGFLIVSEKSFYSLFTLAIFAVIVVFIGSFLRQNMKEPDIALTLIAVWSAVNLWQILSHLEQFNARFSILDRLQQFLLRKRLRNTEFSKKSLLDTQWYIINSKQVSTPSEMPRHSIPVPHKKN